MVIYWRKKQEIVIKVFICIFLFLFMYATSYFISFIKYDNKDYILNTEIMMNNQLLKKELEELRKVEDIDGKLAKVLIRDFYGFYDEVVLDVGKEDVSVSDAVVNENGLVGIVYKVTKNKSYVKLLSSNYNVSVKVGDAYGNYNNGNITMVSKNSNIKTGDLVYTSGLDSVLGNIYIGKVIDVVMDSDNVGKILKVDYVDNTNLNYVIVKGKV